MRNKLQKKLFTNFYLIYKSTKKDENFNKFGTFLVY